MNSLNITNGLYTKDLNFSLIQTHFVMFAFDLLLKLCFWAVCFIFSFNELNALNFYFSLQVVKLQRIGKVTKVASEVITYGTNEITSNLYMKTLKKLFFLKRGF